MEIDAASLEQALYALGELLEDRGSPYEVVAIGGGGLLLLGYLSRMTKDLDLIALVKFGRFISANPLPKDLMQDIRKVGSALELGVEWLNAGPAALFEMGLPEDFEKRMETRRYGGLTVHFAGKFDQICFKLYAAVDQGPNSKHFSDLKLLLPTESELQRAKEWCITHDVSEAFSQAIHEVLSSMRVKNAVT
jgi:hypothetical protein